MLCRKTEFVLFCLFLVFTRNIIADPDPDPQLRLSDFHKTKLTEHFTNYGVGCITEYSINFDDIKALKAFQLPKGAEAPCFFACVLKRAQMMDAQGKITPEAVLAVAKQVFDDEKDLNEAVKVFQACAYVNDKEVSDGSKGCDRAMLALQCLMDQSNMEDGDLRNGGGDGNTATTVGQRNSARLIMSSIVTNILQLACTGVSTVNQLLPLKILSDLLPLDTVATLCSFIVAGVAG